MFHAQVRADREKYCEWKEAQRQRDAYFRQEDTRSEEEKAEEIRMQEQLRTTFQAQIDAEKQAVFREMNKSNTQNAELVLRLMNNFRLSFFVRYRWGKQ